MEQNHIRYIKDQVANQAPIYHFRWKQPSPIFLVFKVESISPLFQPDYTFQFCIRMNDIKPCGRKDFSVG